MKIMQNPIKIDNLGVPLFLETPIWMVQSTYKTKISFGESVIWNKD